MALLLGGVGWGPSLNFFDEASGAVREPLAEKVQAVRAPTRLPVRSVTLAFVPRGTDVEQLGRLGLSVGLMSAGMGSVPAEQTYLDIGQGNRVFDSLYDTDLPPFPPQSSCPAWWRAVITRAESAPADVVPALLTSTLQSAGVRERVGGGAACTFSSSESRTDAAAPPEKLSEAPYPLPAPTFEVTQLTLKALGRRVGELRAGDLVIAIERPPPPKDRALAIGIAGSGFAGDLTSDSTRLDGYVLSTDIAPTVLRRLGIEVPSEMSGQPIRAEGRVDAAAVESLGDRLAVIGQRKGPVIGLGLLIWAAFTVVLILVTRGGAARLGLRLLALSLVFLPLVLLLAAALEPGQKVEQVLAIGGSPVLAMAALALLPGYRALAVASGLTVAAYAIDVIAGSPLTTLCLLGPNPGLGVRFYGIGNELEALLTVLIVAGTGAALSGFASRLPVRTAATVFLATGLPLAILFAAGRFGADVGAAIVLPLGSAAAAAAIAARRRRAVLLAVAAPFAAVALLALIDLISGANAHLTRSVLDAGGLNDLADVAERRLRLSAHSFSRPIVLAFMPLLITAALLAIVGRRRLGGWLRGYPEVRAGLVGALAATLVGALANDSGALVLEIGGAYLLAFTAYAWAEARKDGEGTGAGRVEFPD